MDDQRHNITRPFERIKRPYVLPDLDLHGTDLDLAHDTTSHIVENIWQIIIL